MKPTRPALRYYGGKWRIGKWVISHFPAHQCYVEPYGGAASVLLQKARSPLEVYNDLNGAVVNFFRVLRERQGELIRAIELTLWSRAEYELSQEPSDDQLEEARRFYVTCWQGCSGGGARWRQGWQYQLRSGTLWKPAAIRFRETSHLYQVVERLRGVQIECRDAFEVIEACDAPTTLFYLDPPYLHSTRSKWKHVYANELDDADHEELAGLVRSVEGMVVISGYPSGLYQLCYERYGWTRVETAARTNGGGVTSAFRTEALWISPRTMAALDRRDLPLFNIDRYTIGTEEVNDDIRMGGGDGGGVCVAAVGGDARPG